MDHKKLAQLLLPGVTLTPAEMEARYPKRELKEGAMVTRMAPSPTGFMHLGNLFGAIADERIAHQSGGVFYLRIEDTDQKREVTGGVEKIIAAFSTFGLPFDEGATAEGDNGAYGPYRQRQRAEIYQAYVKTLIERGLAYPCFCTEEDLEQMRLRQQEEKANFGYYGKWAVHRDDTMEQIEENLKAGKPYVIRLRSPGSLETRVKFHDCIKGDLEFPENDQDIVLLKSDGIPTYHFAHVIDDHLMGTTHVVRGEEWLATLPVHLQLFELLGFEKPQYAHTAHLMKSENGGKRKLSKRKDPELALDYYLEQGYPVAAVKEYIFMLLNSNFEEWRIKNPDLPLEAFPFSLSKMGTSGALFDLLKLRDVSKNVLSKLTAQEMFDQTAQWAKQFDPELYKLLTQDPDKALAILAIGRGGPKPRKDLALYSEVKDYLSFFYDELFSPDYTLPEKIAREDAKAILSRYQGLYNPADDGEQWFAKVRALSEELGFAPDTKTYKKNPEGYKGHVGDVSMVLRVALCGRPNSPDLYAVTAILGEQEVQNRLARALEEIG